MKLVYSEIFDSAWQAIKHDLALVAGLSLVYLAGMGLAGRIPVFGPLFAMPFAVGYLRCLMQIRKKETIGFEDIFWGFRDLNRFLHILILGLLVGLGAIVGCVLLILPGIWWIVASHLAVPILALHNLDSVESLKKSLDLVKGRWWNVFGFLFLVGLLSFVGLLCFFIGLLVTVPVGAMALLVATEKLMAAGPVAQKPLVTPPAT